MLLISDGTSPSGCSFSGLSLPKHPPMQFRDGITGFHYSHRLGRRDVDDCHAALFAGLGVEESLNGFKAREPRVADAYRLEPHATAAA